MVSMTGADSPDQKGKDPIDLQRQKDVLSAQAEWRTDIALFGLLPLGFIGSFIGLVLAITQGGSLFSNLGLATMTLVFLLPTLGRIYWKRKRSRGRGRHSVP